MSICTLCEKPLYHYLYDVPLCAAHHRAAMLHLLADNPDNETDTQRDRLVLADWLREAGGTNDVQPERTTTNGTS